MAVLEHSFLFDRITGTIIKFEASVAKGAGTCFWTVVFTESIHLLALMVGVEVGSVRTLHTDTVLPPLTEWVMVDSQRFENQQDIPIFKDIHRHLEPPTPT